MRPIIVAKRITEFEMVNDNKKKQKIENSVAFFRKNSSIMDNGFYCQKSDKLTIYLSDISGTGIIREREL